MKGLLVIALVLVVLQLAFAMPTTENKHATDKQHTADTQHPMEKQHPMDKEHSTEKKHHVDVAKTLIDTAAQLPPNVMGVIRALLDSDINIKSQVGTAIESINGNIYYEIEDFPGAQ